MLLGNSSGKRKEIAPELDGAACIWPTWPHALVSLLPPALPLEDSPLPLLESSQITTSNLGLLSAVPYSIPGLEGSTEPKTGPSFAGKKGFSDQAKTREPL